MEPTIEQRTNEIKSILAAKPEIESKIDKLLEFLPDCEYELILFMQQKGVWKGPLPPPPANFTTGSGYIELGLFLHWFKNRTEIDFSKFTIWDEILIIGIISALDTKLPESLLTKINYDYFKDKELIYTDGTVLSTEIYANFDQGWFIAFFNLYYSIIYNLWYNGGTFPDTTPANIAITGAQADSISIAIIGDWGAGNAASKAVMDQVIALQPDYIVHVGDVYYGGTPSESDMRHYHYLVSGEEKANLLDLWPSSHAGKSFTLNSNHEMYSGANGLFLDALGSETTPPGVNTPFSAQQGASCFSMNFGGWTLLGLDTAYHSSVLSAFMTGSLGTSDEDPQIKWIKSLGLDPNKTIVFSHHNGFQDDTLSLSPLWAEVKNAIGGDPFAWYWGHVHNGIVYDSPITIPSTAKVPGITTNTFARCLGHGALPYGIASSLAGKAITWHEKTPIPSKPSQIYNGFAVLTLNSNQGVLSGISEAFYNTSRLQPQFTKQLL